MIKQKRKRCLSVRRMKHPSPEDVERIEMLAGQLEHSLGLLRNTQPGTQRVTLYGAVRSHHREYRYLTGKAYVSPTAYETED
ncbi:hypothetical protein EXS73_00290 [Candidatus Pacearchaeota archaeon]|nr:hypothetical protein [Candidatus Pacearchaeota archaeon]